MVDICVCVGSSCHMRGSYQVIKTFTELIKAEGLESEIALKASFCMGRCMSGISVSVGDEPIEQVGFVNAQEVFYTQVLPIVKRLSSGTRPDCVAE